MSVPDRDDISPLTIDIKWLRESLEVAAEQKASGDYAAACGTLNAVAEGRLRHLESRLRRAKKDAQETIQ